MQGFDPSRHKEGLTVSFTTDTATPQPIIPIFLIHTREQPFCPDRTCWCQNTKALVAVLIAATDEGVLQIAEVKTLQQ